MKYFLRFLVAAMLLPALLHLNSAARAQAPAFDQAVACASGVGDYGWGPARMVVDNQGNTYVVGGFTGSVVLGNTLLTASVTGGGQVPGDLFVAKLDAAGNYLWAIQGGGNAVVSISDLAVDSAGNLYLTGYFDAYSVTFGTGGPTLFNSSARSEAYVAKLNGTTRQWQWARRYGGGATDYGRAIAVDNAGGVYVTGSCSGTTADFGPFALASAQPLNACWAKLDATGTWLWARQLSTGNLIAQSLAVDAQGSLYVAGAFKAPTASLGTLTLATQAMPNSPTPEGGDVFVAKATNTGNWLWAVQGDALNGQNIAQLGEMAPDGAGHLYLCGDYRNTAARFGNTVLPNLSSRMPQPTPLPPAPYTNNYYSDGFVARLDATTGAWQWAVRTGGALDDYLGGIAADAQGQVCVGGSGTIGAAGGAEFGNPLAAGLANLAVLNGVTGAWRWALATAPVVVRNMAYSATGHLYLSGHFYDTSATFGAFSLPGAGPGMDTGFIARTGATSLSTRDNGTNSSRLGLIIWPNPSEQGAVWVDGPKPNALVEVMDVVGRRVAKDQMPAKGSLRLNQTAHLPAGVYIIRSGSQSQRLIVTQ